MARLCLTLEYDGTDFAGFQIQPNGRSVQAVLEAALFEVTREERRVMPAGRTDAGVHARGQVAHVDSATRLAPGELARALNALLPRDVAVLALREVAPDFDARRDALAKTYTYRILNRAEPSPLRARFSLHLRGALDVAAMAEGAKPLVGTHDFSAFRAAMCQAKSPVKTLARADVVAAGDVIRFDFSANAFLHHMIRNIVGALVHVGCGKAPPGWIGELLASRDRTRGAPTFAADGLYLTGADYDAAWPLPFTRAPLVLPQAFST